MDNAGCSWSDQDQVKVMPTVGAGGNKHHRNCPANLPSVLVCSPASCYSVSALTHHTLVHRVCHYIQWHTGTSWFYAMSFNLCVCVCVLSGKPPPHLMIIIGQDSPFALDSKSWICAPLMSWWKLGVTHFCRLNCWSVGEDTNSMLANSWWSQRQCFVGL